MLKNLSLSYDPAGLPAAVDRVLDGLVTTLQQWVNSGVIESTGALTVTQPKCRMFRQAAQSIPNNTDTAVLWDQIGTPVDPVLGQVQYDTGSLFGLPFVRVANADVVFPPLAGIYLVIAGASFDNNTTGRRNIWLQQRNQSANYFDLASMTCPPDGAAGASQLIISAFFQVPVAQTVETGVRLMAYQNSGGALNVQAGYAGTWLQMVKLS